jgi:outer membrane lipoprotein SlyB
MRKHKSLAVLAAGLLLTGCATTPTGPMVRVMPAPNKPFEVFAQEQTDCEHYASDQVAGGAQAANNRALGATALGAVLGLGVGAATGSGRAATVGAATGGAIGAALGANQSSYASYSLQRRYDIAYSQCMYAKGNYVPGMMAATPPPPPPPRS